MAIPMLLIYIAKKRKDIPFNGMFFMFATFIIGCGLTHFMGALISFVPIYRFDLLVKIATAIVSLVTAFVLFRLIPQILKIKNPEQLAAEMTAELAKKERKYKAILDSAQNSVFLTDTKLDIIYVNERACTTFGWKKEELIGQNVQIIIPVNLIPEHIAGVEKYLKTGVGPILNKAVKTRALKKDGTEFPIIISIKSLAEFTNGTAFSAFIIDLSELEAAKETLRTNIEHLNQLIDEVEDYAIYLLDSDGHVITWNSGALRITGYKSDEILGKHFSHLYPEEVASKGWPEYHLKVAAIEGRFEEESYRLKKDGQNFWANVIITALKDNDGNVKNYLKIVRDLTSKIESEKIKIANATLKLVNEELERFAYVASHDLQDPLRTANAYIKLLDKVVQDQESTNAKEYMQIIIDSNQKMQELVSSLLDYARKIGEPLTLEPVDIAVVVDNAVKSLRESINKINAKITVGEMPTVVADKIQLVRIFQNLIQNAIKYAVPERPLEVNISAKLKKNTLQFAIQDNACGISENDINKLFNLYRRVRKDNKGVGFGLALCKKLISRLGGTIWVDSEEGAGSTFFFTLPATPPE